MWKLVATLALISSPVAAQNFTCAEWSVVRYEEGGEGVLIASDATLTWSNGSTFRTAALIDSDLLRNVYRDGDDFWVAPSSIEKMERVTITRVPISGAQPRATIDCKTAG